MLKSGRCSDNILKTKAKPNIPIPVINQAIKTGPNADCRYYVAKAPSLFFNQNHTPKEISF